MMFGLGEFFSIACAVVWAVAVVLFRRNSHQLGPFETNLVKNGLAFVLLLATIPFTSGLQFPTLTSEQVRLSLISGAIGIAVADVLYLYTLRQIGASRTAIIASLYSPFVVAGSFLFLGERLNAWQMAGFALVLCGILLATWHKPQTRTDRKHYLLGIAAGASSILLMAAAVIMLKHTLEQADFFWVVTLRLAGALLLTALPLCYPPFARKVWHNLRRFRQWKSLLLASFLGTYLAMVLWLAGYRYTSASIAAILNETASIFIVLLAWLFLREPLTPAKGFGVIITTTGVVLLIALGGPA